MNSSFRIPFLLLLFAACRTPGTKPHDMGIASHEQAAREHDKAAADFARECARRPMPAPCWKSRDHWVVKEHQKAAAEHRAASAALRAAEDSTCAGIADDDRAMSPFEHRDDIAEVRALIESEPSNGKFAPLRRQVGVVVTFRAVPGLTAEWLQRSIDCHLARNASLGHIVPEMPDCPLVPRGVKAQVRSVGNGFAVEIRGDDDATVRAVTERAARLTRDDRAGLR